MKNCLFEKNEDVNLVLKLKLLEDLENKISKYSHRMFGYKVLRVSILGFKIDFLVN